MQQEGQMQGPVLSHTVVHHHLCHEDHRYITPTNTYIKTPMSSFATAVSLFVIYPNIKLKSNKNCYIKYITKNEKHINSFHFLSHGNTEKWQ